ncbi:MAG TPA: hypothetical protein VFP71_04475 [Candidatus Angelobacter sp.]|nr:hypothetical protein [Candidatus Angelobacter sp.]
MQTNAMSANDVRAIIRSLQGNLNQDSLLRANFHDSPLTVLQNIGLSREARQTMLQHTETPDDGINCFCGSYISILTTITTINAADQA